MKARREIIRFIRPVRIDDEIGGATFSDNNYWSPIAEVEEIEPGDETLLGQEQWTTTIRIKTRYNPEKPVIVGDVILWRNLEFTVLKPTPDRIKREMTIIATARVFDTQRNGEPLPPVDPLENSLQASLQFQL